jgi:hypothetical protein
MTQTVEFGRLETVSLRAAWGLEATAFTPWLAQNLDQLGEALGIPLEHVQTEAPVTTFSADILARNPLDGSNVLVENQLEESDHGHLGQIMTYLAGLSAKTVIWVAPRFREAHLSAIKWLNENTTEPFSFFAVEVRVVRIGDSPIAPVFDVVERPNVWERAVQERARESRPRASFTEFREAFWTHFLARYPSEQVSGPANGSGSRWRSPTSDGLVVAQYIAQGRVGVFIRGGRGVPAEETAQQLEPYRERLESLLQAPLNSDYYFFITTLRLDTNDRANWDRMSDWLHEQADKYVATLEAVLEGSR